MTQLPWLCCQVKQHPLEIKLSEITAFLPAMRVDPHPSASRREVCHATCESPTDSIVGRAEKFVIVTK